MNGRRVRAIARQELRTHLRSPFLWGLVVFVAFATLAVNPAAMIPSGSAAVEGVRPFSNSVYAMSQSFSLAGMIFYTFLASLLAGLSVIHDDESRVGDLLHSTALTAGEYIAGKFLGVMSALGGVVLLHVMMAMAWYELGPLVGGDSIRGPFSVTSYLWPALWFVFPGVLFCAGLSFAIGERFRAPVAVYAVPTVLFGVTVLALGSQAPLGLWDVPLDVWGARWLSQTVFVTDRGINFYNAAPLIVDRAVILNRLVIVLVPLAAVWWAARHCDQVVRGRVQGRVGETSVAAQPQASPSSDALTDLGMSQRPPAVLRSIWQVARSEISQIRTQPALYLFFLFAVALVWETAGSTRGVFDSGVIFTAGGLAVSLIEVVTGIGCLLLLFHTVESVTRPVRTRLDAIMYATPVPTVAFVLGVHVAGAVLVGALLASCAAVAVMFLVLQPQGGVAVWPFVLLWGIVLAPTFFVWTMGVTAVLALTRSRYLTYVIALAVLMVTMALVLTGSMTWVTNWPLWGALRWTDMGAFELNGAPLLWNRVLMTTVGLVALLVAVRAFARTEGAPRRTGAAVAWSVVPIAVAVSLTVAVNAGFQGPDAREWHDRYEQRNAAEWASVPPPVIHHIDADVWLDPAQSVMRVAGAYELASGPAVDRLVFTLGPAMREVTWTVDGQTVVADNRAGLWVLPSGGGRVGFTYEANVPDGFTRNGGGTSSFVLPSGVLLHTLGPDFLPLPGYVAEYGLDARPFTVEMRVSAPVGLTVNGVGQQTEQRTDGNRVTTTWRSDYPVKFLNLVGGRWTRTQGDGVAVYHHPDHTWNVDAMVSTLAAAKRLYSQWFYPYPWKDLRLNEFPDHATRALGFPTNIPFSEGIGFLTRPDPGLPLPAIVTAHETAHQWWANLVTPGRESGADVLLEGMANFATLLFLEAEHGSAVRQTFAKGLEDQYLTVRRVDVERPMLETSSVSATDEVVSANRGAWVMWMLHRHLGHDRMVAGLQTFVGSAVRTRTVPTLPGLLSDLRSFAPDPGAFDHMVSQWASQTGVPEFRVTDVSVIRAGAGWRVSAVMTNVGSGTVEVDIQVSGDGSQSRQTVALVAGAPTAMMWNVAGSPQRLVVDPDVHVLQLNRARASIELPKQK